MPSILRLENEPKDCPNCPLYVDGRCCVQDEDCPLKPIYTEEDKITPLSKVEYTKYIVHKH